MKPVKFELYHSENINSPVAIEKMLWQAKGYNTYKGEREYWGQVREGTENLRDKEALDCIPFRKKIKYVVFSVLIAGIDFFEFYFDCVTELGYTVKYNSSIVV